MLSIKLKFQSDQDFIMSFGAENSQYGDSYAETDNYIKILNASSSSFSFSFKKDLEDLKSIKAYVNEIISKVSFLPYDGCSSSEKKIKNFKIIIENFKKELEQLTSLDNIEIGGNQYISLLIFEKEV